MGCGYNMLSRVLLQSSEQHKRVHLNKCLGQILSRLEITTTQTCTLSIFILVLLKKYFNYGLLGSWKFLLHNRLQIERYQQVGESIRDIFT